MKRQPFKALIPCQYIADAFVACDDVYRRESGTCYRPCIPLTPVVNSKGGNANDLPYEDTDYFD
jgi:hypothetical protein